MLQITVRGVKVGSDDTDVLRQVDRYTYTLMI